MIKRSVKTENDFRKDIPEYADEQIIEILKKRDHYQEEAAKLAIEEAIKRGIIHSEQDLFTEEYKVEELKTSIWPQINDEKNKGKIRRSIARSIIICGVMPVVYGLVQMNSNNFFEGGAILFFGIVWMVSAAQLIKSYQNVLIYLLISEALAGQLYILLKLILLKNRVFMDFFIPSALFLLILYGLLFIKRCAPSN